MIIIDEGEHELHIDPQTLATRIWEGLPPFIKDPESQQAKEAWGRRRVMKGVLATIVPDMLDQHFGKAESIRLQKEGRNQDYVAWATRIMLALTAGLIAQRYRLVYTDRYGEDRSKAIRQVIDLVPTAAEGVAEGTQAAKD